MSANAERDKLSLSTAEEVLRTIYGDDLKGCRVTLDSIAGIIANAVHQAANEKELVELYEKVIEAVYLLSTPPDSSQVTDSKQLELLLSERLDAIRTVTTKTTEAVSRLKQPRRDSACQGEAPH